MSGAEHATQPPHTTPSGNEFQEIHGGAENFASHLDKAKDAFAKILDAKSAMGTSGGESVASPHIMNAMDVVGKLLGRKLTTADYSALAQWAQQQSPQALQQIQHSGQNAIVNVLKSVLTK
jgi:hypothetical protein